MTTATVPPATADLRDEVRKRYADAARAAESQTAASCCGPSCCGASAEQQLKDAVSRDLYDAEETASLPAGALLASLGCGNPTALAELRPGDTVLDLGSGGGVDVLLSARRVGPSGKAYGLDMTPEMLALARRNQSEAGVANAEFLEGHIESVPLPDATVDVIISNCVVNLSPDKDKVLAEAFRVLKPGGRFAISDILIEGAMPVALQKEIELWSGCLAGALSTQDMLAKLTTAGFAYPSVEVTRVFGPDDLGAEARSRFEGLGFRLEELPGRFVSAFVRATKPV